MPDSRDDEDIAASATIVGPSAAGPLPSGIEPTQAVSPGVSGIEATAMTPGVSGIEATAMTPGVSGIEATQAGPSEPTRPSGPLRDSAPAIRRGPGSANRRYELGAEIARGGMGRVVEATDTVLGRTVAIKEVLAIDDELIRRFERETRITARLEHPSIIPVHDAGRQPNGSPFYVMRKVSGQPLDQLVVAATTLNERLALLPHVLATANALAHAHGRGVIHRDLKPTNILVGKLGETVVIDWGLAKVIDEPDDPADSISTLEIKDSVHTRIGSIVGTPGFMSPEQLRGQAVDAQADVYALGATLYFLLARKPPHAARTGDEMMQAALAGPPTPLRELAPGVPPELETIVEKALAPGTDIRYRDAGGFAHDLERFLAGQLVASHRYSRRERLARWFKRHRLSVTIATIALVTLIAGGWISISRTIKERDRADAALVTTREQNEQLQLSRAIALVPTHPTGAVALARPLAAKYWETARALAMAARARGVAFGLSGSRYTRSLVMARDGIRLLYGGSDGIVRIADLRARTAREIANLQIDAFAAWADDDKTVVAWSGNRLAIVPVAGGTLRELVVAEPVQLLRAEGTRMWWCDTKGEVWTASLTDLAPAKIAIADRVDYLEVRDGNVAFAGAQSLFVSRGGQPPIAVGPGHAVEIAWSPTGEVAAIVGPPWFTRVLDLAPGATTAVVHEITDALCLVFQAGTLWVGSERGLGTLTTLELEVDGGVRQLLAGPGESLVARTQTSAFTLYDTNVIVDVPPTGAIHDLAASPAGTFVAAGSDSVVLVWPLDAVRPQRIPMRRQMRSMWSAADQMIVVQHAEHAQWVDLASLAITPIAMPGEVDLVALAPDGSAMLAITIDHRGVLYRRGAPGSTKIATDITWAEFAGPSKIVVAGVDGKVRLIDLAGTLIRELASGAAPTQQVEVRGDWVVAHFNDGQLARNTLGGDALTTMGGEGRERWIELFDNGDVAYTDRYALRLWRPDGSVVSYAGLLPPVTAVESVGNRQLVVYTGGDSASLVEIDGGHRMAAVYPPGTRMFWLRYEGDLGVNSSPEGALFGTSPRTAVHWRIAMPRNVDSRIFGPVMTRDRTRIVASSGDSLLVWSQIVPNDAAETAALFDSLTNAQVAENPAGAIPVAAPTLRLRW